MEVTTRDGRRTKFRLVTAIAESGFMLSPVVSDSLWFSWLASTPWQEASWQRLLAGKGVRSIEVLRPNATYCVQPDVVVRLFRLRFRPCGHEATVFRPEMLALFELAAGERSESEAFFESTPHGVALVAAGGTQLSLPVGEHNRYFSLARTMRLLHVTFGLAATGAEGSPPTRPVRFRIRALDDQGQHQTVWTREWDSGSPSSAAGIESVNIPVSLAAVRMLHFETETAETGTSVSPAWFRVTTD